MDSNKMTRAEMIEWLGNAISAETDKPFEDIDYDFVDECGQLLDELIGVNHITEEEAVKRATRLKSKSNKREKKVLKPRRLIRILVAAAIVMCMSVTVLAIPQLRVMILQALELDVGETINTDNITYIHSGQITEFSDINSLIAAEKLDILSFCDIKGEIEIISLNYIDSVSATTITFNDSTINCIISHNQDNLSEEIIKRSEKYVTQIFTAYILSNNIYEKTYYDAYFRYGKDTYTVECQNLSTLYQVLDSFTKET